MARQIYIPNYRDYSSTDEAGPEMGNAASTRRGIYVPSYQRYTAATGESEEERLKREREEALKAAKAQSGETGPPGPSIIDRAKGIVGGVASGVAAPFKRLGEGVGEVVGADARERQSEDYNTAISTNTELIQKASQRLKDKSLSKEAKARWRKTLEDATKNNEALFKEANAETSTVIERADPVKGAASVGDIGFTILTAGTGSGAVSGAKEVVKTGSKEAAKQLARKIAVGGAQGAVSGGLYAVEDKGRGVRVADIVKSATTGAALGAAIPAASSIYATGKRGVQTATQKGAQELIEQGVSAPGLEQVAQKGVVGAIDSGVNRAARRTAYTISDLMQKTAPGRVVVNAKDRFMTRWVSDLHPLYKQVKRLEFEGDAPEGSFAAVREAIGSSNRALSYADDFINENPHLQEITASLQQRGLNLTKVRRKFEDFAKVKSELDLAQAGKKEFTPARMAELNKQMSKFADDGFDKEYANLVSYYKDLNDFRLSEGLMSKEQYQQFLDEPFDYVRQQREVPQWLMDKPGGGAGGSKASITKSAAIQKRNKYASGDLLSPLETAIKATQVAHVEAARNRAAKTVYGILDEAGEAKLLRSTANVQGKRELLKDLKVSKPIVTKMNRTLRTQTKRLQALEKEIDNLNAKGLDIKLKEGAPEVKYHSADKLKLGSDTAGVGADPGTVLGYKTMIEDGKLNQIDPIVVRTVDGVPYVQDGQNRLQAFRESGIKRIPTIEQAVDQGTPDFAPELLEKLKTLPGKSKNTRELVRNLVAEDPAELRKIRALLETRQPKLAPLMDQIELLSRDLHDLSMTRQENWQTAKAIRTGVDKSAQTTMSFLDDGVENVVKIDPSIASAVHNWDQQSQNVLNTFLRTTNNIFKYGTTGANAAFALPNFAADQIGSAVNSRAVFATHNPVNFVHSMFMALGKPLTPEDRQILEGFVRGNKGALNINQYTRPATANRVANELVRKNSSKLARTYNYIANPRQGIRALFDSLENVVGFTEKATRVQNYRGIYKKAVKEGLDAGAAAKGANLAARENTIDFLEMGSYGRVVNSFIPYFNAGIQGTRTIMRNVADRPVSSAAKITALVTMPVAATTIWNTSDSKRKAIYDTIPDYVKETNFVVIQPNAHWDEEKRKWEGVRLFKKPLGISAFAEPVRKYIEYVADNDPDKANTLAGFLKDEGAQVVASGANSLSPVDVSDPNRFLSSVTPQILKPTAEGILNRNFFTGEDIVPEQLRDLAPEDQKYDNYSAFSAFVAKKFNTSPLKVDAWIKGTFGEVGTNVQHEIDQGAVAAGAAPPEAVGGRSIGESIERRFSGAPGGADTDAFWEKMNPAKAARRKASSEVTELVKAGRTNEAKRKADEFNATINSRFADFFREYGDSPTYREEWNDYINDLYIPVSKQGFAARARQ